MNVKDKSFTLPTPANIEPVLLDFVKTRANSFVKWELMRYFDQNPQTSDTVENIARFIGRKPDVVKPALDALVDSRVIKKQELNNSTIYSLANDEDIRKLIDKFNLAYEDRHFRIKAVSQILPGIR